MKGFKFAGIHAGIKKNNDKDLGLIYCEQPAAAAALFTKNKVTAAPVILGKKKIKSGFIQAVLVNSGNANCFTGKKGIEDAITCSQLMGKCLDLSQDLVLVSSTGVIGANLPMEKFETGIPEIVKHLSADNINDFGTSILTTDTHHKIVKKSNTIGGKPFSIIGFAKGSGMIRPDMATMLAYICTDVDILPQKLKKSLTMANVKSFNRITIDGDTSTNDTLLALANSASGVKINNSDSAKIFQNTLDKVCFQLAKMIIKDGEGATKFVQILVKGAKTKIDAFKASEAIAHSNLVKTAIYGEDPNWGRIVAAAGRSGAQVSPEKMDLFFDEQPLVLQGNWMGTEAEQKTAQMMKKDEITITLDLNLGKETDRFFFCDFSEEYVKINADYRS